MEFTEVPSPTLRRYKETLLFGLSLVGLGTGRANDRSRMEGEKSEGRKKRGGGQEKVQFWETMLMKGPGCRTQPWASSGHTPPRSALMPQLLLPHTEATPKVLKCKSAHTPFSCIPHILKIFP